MIWNSFYRKIRLLKSTVFYSFEDALCNEAIQVGIEFLDSMGLVFGGQNIRPYSYIQSDLYRISQPFIPVPQGGCSTVFGRGISSYDLRQQSKSLRMKVTGSVGSDVYAQKFMQEYLTMPNVTFYPIKKTGPTTVCRTLVDPVSAQRTFLVYLGVESTFNEVLHWAYQVQNLHTPIYLCGYLFIKFSAHEIETIFKIISQKNIVVFDLADPAFVLKDLRTTFKIIENYVDILFFNELECQALQIQNPLKACIELGSKIPVVISKLGEHGSHVSYLGQYIKGHAVRVNNVVDTTGAGDMFAAGFCAQYFNTFDVHSSLHAAAHKASRCITHFGSTLGFNPPKVLLR